MNDNLPWRMYTIREVECYQYGALLGSHGLDPCREIGEPDEWRLHHMGWEVGVMARPKKIVKHVCDKGDHKGEMPNVSR